MSAAVMGSPSWARMRSEAQRSDCGRPLLGACSRGVVAAALRSVRVAGGAGLRAAADSRASRRAGEELTPGSTPVGVLVASGSRGVPEGSRPGAACVAVGDCERSAALSTAAPGSLDDAVSRSRVLSRMGAPLVAGGSVVAGAGLTGAIVARTGSPLDSGVGRYHRDHRAATPARTIRPPTTANGTNDGVGREGVSLGSLAPVGVACGRASSTTA